MAVGRCDGVSVQGMNRVCVLGGADRPLCVSSLIRSVVVDDGSGAWRFQEL